MAGILVVLTVIAIGVWRTATLLARISAQLHAGRNELKRYLTSDDWYGDFNDMPREQAPFYLVPMLVRQMDRVRQDVQSLRDSVHAR